MRREDKVPFFPSVCTCMVDVSAQAQQTPARVKVKLVYCNTDELDTGMQKVQPLPFLGMIHYQWQRNRERFGPSPSKCLLPLL